MNTFVRVLLILEYNEYVNTQKKRWFVIPTSTIKSFDIADGIITYTVGDDVAYMFVAEEDREEFAKRLESV